MGSQNVAPGSAAASLGKLSETQIFRVFFRFTISETQHPTASFVTRLPSLADTCLDLGATDLENMNLG